VEAVIVGGVNPTEAAQNASEQLRKP
jgi:glycerate 2-kinase